MTTWSPSGFPKLCVDPDPVVEGKGEKRGLRSTRFEAGADDDTSVLAAVEESTGLAFEGVTNAARAVANALKCMLWFAELYG
jgi:hypothetical protein